jgi:hypothetical protein
VTARSVTACQAYMHRLLAPHGVLTGSLICGPAAQLDAWIAPRLGFYAVDINGDWFIEGGTLRVREFERREAANLAVWQRKARSARPRLVVGETNCGQDHVRFRAEWFTLLASWLSAHGGGDVITYWSEPGRTRQGHGTGPWPPSGQVISRLRDLSATLYGSGPRL